MHILRDYGHWMMFAIYTGEVPAITVYEQEKLAEFSALALVPIENKHFS